MLTPTHFEQPHASLVHPTTCITFKDYVTTLPQRRIHCGRPSIHHRKGHPEMVPDRRRERRSWADTKSSKATYQISGV
jgi:hypothetical protein